MGSYCLFGAAPDTGNLGVSALCASILASVVAKDPDARVTVFDYGRGRRNTSITLRGEPIAFFACGAFDTRRFYKRESLWNIRVSGWFGGLRNPACEAITSADAVLDISGGDSFTDLYGNQRFWAVVAPKLIAMERKRPLILLPQTYGPFRSKRIRRLAERVVRTSAMAWARDTGSFEILRSLAGSDFDATKHCSGVDVAFGLPSTEPANPLPAPLAAWLAAESSLRVAVNVSGMIYNDEASASRRYGFKAEYRQVIDKLLRRLLEQTDSHILLVPHVLAPTGHYESDIDACQNALDALGPSAPRERIGVLPPLFDASETKWIISHAEWFCGTRMHSTIAALSSGVPAAAIAYSDKTKGVFATCGQAACVADPRTADTDLLVEDLWSLWEERGPARLTINSALPMLVEKARRQIYAMLGGFPGRAKTSW